MRGDTNFKVSDSSGLSVYLYSVPRPGVIVALLDPVSSEENRVEFFLAKTARFSESHLIHLEMMSNFLT